MKIKELGEQGIIRIFQTYFQKFSFDLSQVLVGIQTPTGINEDCAIIDVGADRSLVITTDLIGEKTHKPPGMSLAQFGMKSVTVNVSDLAAVGAKPVCLVMSAGFPGEREKTIIEEIALGMTEACETYKVPIVGGDVNSTDDIILAGTAIGLSPSDQILSRKTAQVGDILAVTGTLGDAAAALKILTENLSVPKSLARPLLAKLYEPIARIEVSLRLAEARIPTSCADITDGLAWELHKIAASSTIGIEVDESKIPVSPELKALCANSITSARPLIMNIGEDFELLMTLPPPRFEEAADMCRENGISLTKMGRILEKSSGIILIDEDGKSSQIPKKGYDQFTES